MPKAPTMLVLLPEILSICQMRPTKTRSLELHPKGKGSTLSCNPFRFSKKMKYTVNAAKQNMLQIENDFTEGNLPSTNSKKATANLKTNVLCQTQLGTRKLQPPPQVSVYCLHRTEHYQSCVTLSL